jgi:hypothetical protein
MSYGVRFPSITLMTVGAIRAAGLRLSPSGRNPLHHSIDFDDLAVGASRVRAPLDRQSVS